MENIASRIFEGFLECGYKIADRLDDFADKLDGLKFEETGPYKRGPVESITGFLPIDQAMDSIRFIKGMRYREYPNPEALREDYASHGFELSEAESVDYFNTYRNPLKQKRVDLPGIFNTRRNRKEREEEEAEILKPHDIAERLGADNAQKLREQFGKEAFDYACREISRLFQEHKYQKFLNFRYPPKRHYVPEPSHAAVSLEIGDYCDESRGEKVEKAWNDAAAHYEAELKQAEDKYFADLNEYEEWKRAEAEADAELEEKFKETFLEFIRNPATK